MSELYLQGENPVSWIHTCKNWTIVGGLIPYGVKEVIRVQSDDENFIHRRGHQVKVKKETIGPIPEFDYVDYETKETETKRIIIFIRLILNNIRIGCNKWHVESKNIYNRRI